MKIIGFETFLTNAGLRNYLFIRLSTDTGLTGIGEASLEWQERTVQTIAHEWVEGRVLGRDPFDIEAIIGGMVRDQYQGGATVMTAISGVEIALWDLLGKRAGQPLWQLLGGGEHRTLQAYASLLHYGDDALVAKNTAAACAQGYRHIKLHEITRQAVLAAKNAPGAADARIMLDVNCAWSPPAARLMAASLQGDGLLWLEEPVWPPEDVDGLTSVRDCGIPIAAGENCCFATQFAALFEARAVQYAQPSVTKLGGVTEFRKVAALAGKSGGSLAPHSPYFGPGALATLHLIAALAEQARFEYFYLQADAGMYGDLLAPRRGELKLPQAPGLGTDPDPDVIRRYRAD